jgi:phage gpG-like protein
VIKVSVKSNAAKIASQVLKAKEKLQNFETPNRLLSIALYSWTIRNFNTQGRTGGATAWAPLAESTIRRKKKLGKTQPLVITGNLRQSFAPFYDSKIAGVGAQASAFKGARGDYAL